MKKILLILLLANFSNIVAQDHKINWLSIEEVEVLQQKEPRKVLMDVYTTWCGPCKVLSPILEELSSEVDGVEFVKLDVDQHQEFAAKYGVRNIPTVLLFDKGKLVGKQVGVAPKKAYADALDAVL